MASHPIPVLSDAIPYLAYYTGQDWYEDSLWLLRNGQSTPIGANLKFHPDYTTASWSPDGKRLAFIAAEPKPGKDFSDLLQLWIVNIDSLRYMRMPETPQSLQWSPDGTRIAYTVKNGDIPRIYIRDAHTGTALDHDLLYDAPFAGWMDSQRVLLLENKFSISANNQILRPLYLTDLRDGSTRKLADQVSRVVVAPDRKRLAVSVSEAGSAKTSILILDDTGQILKTHADGYVWAWSPDSSHIAYSDDNRDFFISPVDAVQPVNLSAHYQHFMAQYKNSPEENVSILWCYGWSGDGKHVYVDLTFQTTAPQRVRLNKAIYKAAVDGGSWETVVSVPVQTDKPFNWVPCFST
jgi:dipeptidyl aminopeptidase/acylaminoacyl peptidase